MMLVRIFSFLAALALVASNALAQGAVTLPVDQARALALQALFSGQSETALDIAEAILLELPDDRSALMVVAAAAPEQGDPARGRAAGAQAWALSTTDVERYEAARLTAAAAAASENFTIASFWLRRALNVAPNNEERARTINDARGISRRNPWSSNLSFSVAPSTNVNGGAEEEELSIDGNPTGGRISADGVAIAGWRAILNAGTQYRLYEDAGNRAAVALAYQGMRVRITEDTAVTDEALRTDTLQLSLRYDRALENGTLGVSVSEALYQYRDFDLRSGETDVEDYRTSRIGLTRNLNLSDRAGVLLFASRERVLYSETSGLDAINRNRLGASVTYVRDNRDRIGMNLSLGTAESDAPNSVQRDQTLSLSYSWAEPIGPVTLSTGLGATWRNYPDFVVFDPSAPSTGLGGFVPLDGGRDDTTLFANLDIGFPEIEYFGFRPGVRIDASRTASNVSRFETTSLSAGLTLTSVF